MAPLSSRLVDAAGVDRNRCAGCGRCVGACPVRRLALERDGWEKYAAVTEGCCPRACRSCADICLLGAIQPPPG